LIRHALPFELGRISAITAGAVKEILARLGEDIARDELLHTSQPVERAL
jgi:hypothetical protein